MVQYDEEVEGKGVENVQTLEVLIEQNALGTVRPMEVAANAPVSALVPAIVDELQLPKTDLFGNKLVYLLRYTSGGPVLPENKSLVAAGVNAGAKLALDSYVVDGTVARLVGQQGHLSPDFHASHTIADSDAFHALAPRHSDALPPQKRRRKGQTTRRAFLLLGGAALGVGAAGLGYAAYNGMLFNGNAGMMTQSVMRQPTTPQQTKTTAAPSPVPTMAKAALVFTQHQQTVRAVTWSPDGKMLASGANDAMLLTWDMDGAVRVQLRQRAPVRAVAWSPDGMQLAAGAGNQVSFFNAVTGLSLAQPAQGHNGTVTTLAWSPGQPARLVSGANDMRAIVWNTTTYMPQVVFTRHTAIIESASWTADSQTVATSSHGGVVRVWNGGNGQELHPFYLDAQIPMRALSFAPNGQLAVGGDDGVVRLWNSGLTCQQTVQGQFGVQCVDMPVRLRAHAKAIRAVAWSPDGRFLATGGDDGVLALWYPARGLMSLLKVQQNAPVLALAWAPGGKQIATASGNTVTLWGLN